MKRWKKDNTRIWGSSCDFQDNLMKRMQRFIEFLIEFNNAIVIERGKALTVGLNQARILLLIFNFLERRKNGSDLYLYLLD